MYRISMLSVTSKLLKVTTSVSNGKSCELKACSYTPEQLSQKHRPGSLDTLAGVRLELSFTSTVTTTGMKDMPLQGFLFLASLI
jgi:hypothetical protein